MTINKNTTMVNTLDNQNILFSENIKFLRQTNNFSQDFISKLVNKTRAGVSLWEIKKRNPSIEDLIILSDFFKISIDNLIMRDLKIEGVPQYINDTVDKSKIPVFNHIPIDIPLEENKNVIGWIDISDTLPINSHKYFGLKITDDTMSPVYCEGDTVIFQEVSDYVTGKDYVVILDDGAKFKRVIKLDGGVILQSLNFEGKAYHYFINTNKSPIKVIGVAKEIRRRVGGD